MIKIENFEVVGWEHAIRGMRNPKNSWDKSDSGLECEFGPCDECTHNTKPCSYWGYDYVIGENDHDLMMRLAHGGPVHAKYRRMIGVYVDITAPLYWWKEFDTYKVGTVANSCSTMHKIHEKEFTLDDFSCEHLMIDDDYDHAGYIIEETIDTLNYWRDLYLLCTRDIKLGKTYGLDPEKSVENLKMKQKKFWWQMIQLLPSSYNQKRTVLLNYEVLANIYEWRNNHKLDEWKEFCMWIEELPYFEIITDPYWDKVNERIETQNRIKGLEESIKELTAKNEQLRLKLLECVK